MSRARTKTKPNKAKPYDPSSVGKERATIESTNHALSSRVGADGRQHVVRDVLDFYRDCGMLDRADDRRNAILWQAGDKYRTVHAQAGLTGLSALDYGRTYGGDGDPAYGMPTSERAMSQRIVFRRADQAVRGTLGPLYGRIVYAVLVEGAPIEDVATVDHADLRTRKMFGLEFLRTGLDALARHWGMINARPVTVAGENHVGERVRQRAPA